MPARNPLIGRKWELEQLTVGLNQARAGQGGLYSVTGEAGIGKTRLCLELADVAERQHIRVLWGRCWEAEESPAFWPWTQIFRALRTTDTDLAPELTALLSSGASTASPSEQARFRLFDAAADLIQAVCAERPMVLILDDLHAADRSSLLLLEFVARQIEAMPLLLIATYRLPEAELMTTGGDTLGRAAQRGRRLPLTGMPRDEVAAFLSQRYSIEAAADVLVALEEGTAGNPFFLEEVARNFVLGSDAPTGPGGGLAVPEGLRESIRRRVERLPEESQSLLKLAAVIGREFSFGLLAEAAGLSRAAGLGQLADLASARMVDPAGFGLGPNRFVHALVRETIYQDLPAAERLRLHACIGEAIERRHAADIEGQLDSLAHHFAQAAALGGADKAIDYAERAAAKAARNFGFEEAAAHYRRALELVDEHVLGPVRRFDVLVSLGNAQWWAGQVSEARKSFDQAATIARRLNDPHRLAEVALRFGETGYGGVYGEAWLFDGAKVALLEDAQQGLDNEETDLAARVSARLAASLYFSPFDSTARRDTLSSGALETARRLGDPGCLAYALTARHLAVWSPDNTEERASLAGEIVELAASAGDPILELTGRSWLLADLMELGRVDQADVQIEAYSALAERLADPHFLGYALLFRAMRSILKGDFAEAESLSRASLACGEKIQDANIELSHHIQLMVIRAMQGRVSECREHLEAVTRDMPAEAASLANSFFLFMAGEKHDFSDQIPGMWFGIEKWTPAFRLLGLSMLAFLAGSAGGLEENAQIYEALLPYAGRLPLGGRDAISSAAPVELYLGILASSLSRYEDAALHFEAAITICGRWQFGPNRALAGAYYGMMLSGSPLAEDRLRGAGLIQQALDEASKLGTQDSIRAIVGTAEPRDFPVEPEPLVFRIEGDFRTVAFDGKVIRLKDAKGLRYLQTLLAAPGRDFHVLDLASGGAYGAGSSLGEETVHGWQPFGSDTGPLLDSSAKSAYRRRIAELSGQTEEAEELGDTELAAELRAELEFVVGELSRALGLGGRDRSEPSPAERARSAVSKSIHSALKHIARVHPSLGTHLDSTVRTGYLCSYKPDPRVSIEWKV